MTDTPVDPISPSKSLLGRSTQGALKTLTLATSLGAVVSLPMVLVASIFA